VAAPLRYDRAMTIPATARLYFRPTAFIDAPFGLDGQFARLAGGMQFFAAWDVIAVESGRRLPQQLVPVERIDQFLTLLSTAQAQTARTAIANATSPRAPLTLGTRTIRLDQPQVMGILNMTPDSFSGGSDHLDDPAAAAALGVDMAAAGAAIIDVGGESTRPGAAAVWEQDEIGRVAPVIERLAASGTAVSIDTRKSAVIERALIAGAGMINDVSALGFDDRSMPLVAKAACPVVLMHYPGTSADPHSAASYRDPLIEVYQWLAARIEMAVAGGIDRARIIIDPGIGFGKAVGENLALLGGLSLFHTLGCPLLLGASRKRLIGALSNEVPADKRLGGSIALALKGAEQGAQIIRVHDVFESVQALHIWRGMRDAALSVG
jgi:dihydropteroate synthase